MAALIGIALLAGAGLAWLWLPTFADQRARIAADLLSTALGHPVVVTGDVRVTPGRTVSVTVDGIAPADAPGPGEPRAERRGRLELAFALWPALAGRLELGSVALSGVRIVHEPAPEDPHEPPLGPVVASALEGFLTSPVAHDLRLSDVRYIRRGDPDGWDMTLAVDSFAAQATADGAAIQLDAAGTLNDRAFKLAGRLPEPTAAAPADGTDDLDVTLAVPGLEGRLVGDLSLPPEGPVLEATLRLNSPALGAIQDALNLARVVEGKGEAAIVLHGPVAKLSAPSITAEVTTEHGQRYTVQGAVADLWDAGGIDARAVAELADVRHPIAPRSIRGRIIGDLQSGLVVQEVVVETGLAALELREIGPITIDRIGRSDDGRLELTGISLLQGTTRDPVLDLDGQILDALALRGIKLAGRFRLPLAGLLDNVPKGAALGELRGTAAISDATGQIKVDRLDAATTGTTLLELALKHGRRGKADGLNLRLQVPDAAALAHALGVTAPRSTPFGFDGFFDLAKDGASVLGTATVGATALEIALAAGGSKTVRTVTGTLATKRLDLASLVQVVDIARAVRSRPEFAAPSTQHGREGVRVALEVTADAVAIGPEQAGPLRTTIHHQDGRVRLDPIQLAILGGTVQGKFGVDMSAAPPRLQVDATVRQIALERLFALIEPGPAPAGPLDAELSVSAAGTGVDALLKSLSGSVRASVRGGSMPGRSVDLAGQSVFTWMVTPTADGRAPIVCAVAAFDLVDGVAKARELVLETTHVQLVGGGTVNLDTHTLDLVLTPRPLRRAETAKIGSVAVTGPLDAPKVKTAEGAVAAKVLGDTLGLPFEILGKALGGTRPAPGHEPCVVNLAATR